MPDKPPAKRRPGSGSQVLLLAILLIAVPMASWAWLRDWWGGSGAEQGPITCVVESGTFVHEVSEKGTIECASNVEVKSEADAKGFYRTTILEIVPEGTYVEPGDFLMRLDSSPLEELLIERTIECNEREAGLVQAKADAETARIELDEYLNGLYPQNKERLSNELDSAREEFRQAGRTFDFSKDMYRRGFVTDLALEADRYSLERAKMQLEQAKTKLNVLKQYSRKKDLKTLEAELAVAEARVRYRQHVYDLSLKELDHIREQIDKCVIRAPAAGNVVYVNDRRGREQFILEPGVSVHEQQVVFRLPNSDQMQVKVRIPEEDVALVKPGQPARVYSEAFPNVELQGEVKRVSKFASPTHWWGPQTKVYETLVTIDTASAKAAGVDLRPGLSGEVFIEVDRREDQRMVPFQAVLKHGKKRYCLTYDGKFHAREVEVGPSNDKFVVVEEGLEAGERVILGAAQYRDKVALPELKSENASVNHLP